MEQFEKLAGGAFPQMTPPAQWTEDDWFGVSGDLDDFIFYDGWPSDDEFPSVSRR